MKDLDKEETERLAKKYPTTAKILDLVDLTFQNMSKQRTISIITCFACIGSMVILVKISWLLHDILKALEGGPVG